MVIVGHHSTPLWALVGAAVFVLCQAKPQNYAFRFNQQPLTGVLAPNGQSQYTTLVTPLVEGCIDILSSGFAFTGSVTMVQDNGCNIIIDTPTATDVGSKTKMLSALMQRSCSPAQINMVVTTHGHPDHFGQVSLFPNARHFFDAFEITGNTFIPNGLNDNETIKLTPNVELWSTPGHTPQDTSIVVRNVPCCGTISIVGDLIYREADVLNSTMWELGAWSVAVGMPNRYRIICVSDHIVPGHGPMFRVTDAMRTLAQCPTTTSPNGNGIVPPISTIPPPEPITGEPGTGIGNGIVTDFPPLSPDTLPTPPPFDPNQPQPTLLPFLPDQPIPTDPLPTDTMPTDPTPTDVYPPMPVSPTDQLPPDQLPQQPLDQDPLQPPVQTFPPFPSPSETQAPTYVQYQQPLYQQPPMVQVQYQQPSQAQPRPWLGK